MECSRCSVSDKQPVSEWGEEVDPGIGLIHLWDVHWANLCRTCVHDAEVADYSVVEREQIDTLRFRLDMIGHFAGKIDAIDPGVQMQKLRPYEKLWLDTNTEIKKLYEQIRKKAIAFVNQSV